LPGTTVTVDGPVTKTVYTDGEGAFVVDGLPPGRYVVSAALSGFTTQTTDVDVATSAVTMEPLSLAVASLGETVVVSASRIETTVLTAPATMSVISSDTIESAPSQQFGGLLRNVPGLNVVQTSARDVNITSRQASSTLSTSQLVLVDGRSVYLDFFGFVAWDFVPTDPVEIGRASCREG